MKKIKYYIFILKATLFCVTSFLVHSNNVVFAYETGKSNQIVSDGIYTIKSVINENLVFDIEGGSTKDGGNLELWKNGNTSNQKFIIKYIGEECYTISVLKSGLYIDVQGNKKEPGTNVLQWTYHGGENQQWIIKNTHDGYYNIISKASGLYLDIPGSKCENGANIHIWTKNDANNQKFILEKIDKNEDENLTEIKEGRYVIVSETNNKSVLDITSASLENCANVELWLYGGWEHQQFDVKCTEEGYFTISVVKSGKMLDVAGSSKNQGANVIQYEETGNDNQKWIIRKNEDGYYSVISKCNGLYLDVTSGSPMNGTNIEVWSNTNGTKSQRFKFIPINEMEITNINENRLLYDPATIFENKIHQIEFKHFDYVSHKSKYLSTYTGYIDENKYPGYKNKLDVIKRTHPNWNIKLLMINHTFSDVVSGEIKRHGTNLVPNNSNGTNICEVCGSKSYDTGWYCASKEAVKYYLDPRNFLTDEYIFQFLDVNQYTDSYSSNDIKKQIKGTFLEGYENDILYACKIQGVEPLFIITRLFQENGRSGSYTSRGMYDSEYDLNFFNPFNIGASGNTKEEVYRNALITAKKYGWCTMERALEGGIEFLKAYWLENCQNTIYLNKFDIDDSNGTSLYTHQYMQNLMAGYSEGKILMSIINNLGTINSNYNTSI